MKKTGNIIFWVIIFVILMFTASTIYNRMKPGAVERFPVNEKENTLSDKDEDTTSKPEEDTSNSENDATEKAAPAAPDFSLEDMNGSKVTLSDYKGKIVFLNFWATWCSFCVQEMPELDNASKSMAEGEDAILLTVNIQEDLDKVQSFMEDNKLSLPVLMDYDGKVSGLYRVSGIPVTYIIDKDGTLYGRISGPTDYDTLKGAIEDIKGDS